MCHLIICQPQPLNNKSTGNFFNVYRLTITFIPTKQIHFKWLIYK